MTTEAQSFWKKCSSCKKQIEFSTAYYICSVSSCNGLRTGYVFCSVSCFERHLPGARHKDAGAVEKRSQSKSQFLSEVSTVNDVVASPAQGARVIISRSAATSSGGGGLGAANAKLPREVLVIASRLKEYVQARSEFNTSASVMDVLSDYLRIVCDRGIDNARSEGRKTLMDRDFEFLKKS